MCVCTGAFFEQLGKYKRTKKAITETIRICKERNVLKEYLESREKEVADIMSTLFDEERILQIHIENRVKEEAEKVAEKVAEKAEEKAAEKMLKTGKLTIEEIADCLTGLSVEDVERIKEKLEQKV